MHGAMATTPSSFATGLVPISAYIKYKLIKHIQVERYKYCKLDCYHCYSSQCISGRHVEIAWDTPDSLCHFLGISPNPDLHRSSTVILANVLADTEAESKGIGQR